MQPSDGGEMRDCYSTATVTGGECVGGLVGQGAGNRLKNCYSNGRVTGDSNVGGLLGDANGPIERCFWDAETSGQTASAGGTGLATAEMKTAAPYLAAGWDFIGETENGTDDIWWILEGQDYPRLWWELEDEEPEP
jgi:hypothetical protein